MYRCNDNAISSLEGGPISSSYFNISNNALTNLHDIHRHIMTCGRINLEGNPITSSILCLFKIQKLKFIIFSDKTVEKIVNDNLENGDIISCQDALLEAGYDELARI
jgi:hypothetical protein